MCIRDRDNVGSYKGDLDALKGAMSYIRRSKQRYCIVMNSNVIFNSTFEDLLNFHIDHGADITVMYTESDPDAIRESDGHVTIRMDDRSRIWDMEINAPQNKSNNQLMGVAVMEKGLLENLVEDSIAHGNTNFTKHILLPRLDELRVYGFKYPGYVARIDSVLSYYKHNMALLDPAVRADLLGRAGDVYTKVKDEVPARYESCLLYTSGRGGAIDRQRLLWGVFVPAGPARAGGRGAAAPPDHRGARRGAAARAGAGRRPGPPGGGHLDAALVRGQAGGGPADVYKRQAFNRAMSAYFQAGYLKNAYYEDLLAALESATGQDWRAWFDRELAGGDDGAAATSGGI